MDPETAHKREEALAFLKTHEAGVLATIAEAGTPRARLVYYTCDDDFTIYFLTLKSTRKANDLSTHKEVAFVVSDMEPPKTLQVEGKAEDLTKTAVNDELLTTFIRRLMSHTTFGIPLERLDADVITFYRVTPSWIRWGDFTFGQGTKHVLTEIDSHEN